MSLIGILIVLIIVGVVFWCARQLIRAFSIPDPIATVIYVLLVLVALVWLLGQIGYGPNIRITP